MSDRYGNISISDSERKEPSSSTPPPKKTKRVKKDPPPTVPKKKGSGKWLLFLLIPSLLFGLYCGAGFYLVPTFIT